MIKVKYSGNYLADLYDEMRIEGRRPGDLYWGEREEETEIIEEEKENEENIEEEKEDDE